MAKPSEKKTSQHVRPMDANKPIRESPWLMIIESIIFHLSSGWTYERLKSHLGLEGAGLVHEMLEESNRGTIALIVQLVKGTLLHANLVFH